jgi:asparagine synthase (glutamine-hydrolysing)
MCGIAGAYSSRKIVVSDVKRMTDIIAHRGPDGEGQWVNKEGSVGLGHRRLAIIDLSDAGFQPMFTPDKRYSIVFNGEIYNFIELREQMIKEEISFSSHSDTEVLLKLYIDKGEDCVKYLDGMFAFAIYDETEQKLFCARDRFGEKPFYYHYEPGKHFVFGSEIKVLQAYGIGLEFLPHRIGWYFNDKYALSNPARQEETFFKNVYKLESGFCLTVDRKLQMSKYKYWDIQPDKIDLSISLEEAKEQFRYLFFQSVQKRLRSDVPLGTSLSGGLDSSSVVCAIANILEGQGTEQKTFSARFKNYDLDEGQFIEEVIKGKALKAYYTWPEGDELFKQFETFMYHQEEPVGTANQFSQWEVMKLAKRENVTVLLDGQGADEIITGYSHYFDIYFNQLYNEYPDRFEGELNAYVTNFDNRYQFVKAEKQQAGLISRTKELIYPAFSKVIRPMMPARKNRTGLLNPDFGFEANKGGRFKYFDYSEGLNQGLYNDAKNGKMEVLLRYGDKNSMAHGREVRLPFLNHDLAEFVFSLPPWFKIHDGWSKYIMRESLKDILPPKIAWRKDKIGYQTPQERWMARPEFRDMVQESIKILEDKGILNHKREIEDIDQWEWQILNVAILIKQLAI